MSRFTNEVEPIDPYADYPTETTLTLTAFLLARIADEETVARRAIRFADAYDDEPSDDGDEWAAGEGAVWTERQSVALAPGDLWEPAAVMTHIARHDPARVLAECEAKRRIVEWCVGRSGPQPWSARHTAPNYWEPLWMLALPYADHPDYREEWRR